MRFFCSILLIIFGLQSTYAASPNLTLQLQDANLVDVIRLIANCLHINVMISPGVRGTVTMNLDSALPTQALNVLLSTHNLAAWKKAGIWYIAPQTEIIQRQQARQQWLEAAELTTKFWPIKYANAEQIAKIIASNQHALLSKRGSVYVDGRTNSLCIQDTAERIEHIQQLIAKLDISVQQIAIMARLVSVDNTFESELGIDFSYSANLTKNLTPGYNIALVKLANMSQLDVKLSALEKSGHAELISRPSLFTANQRMASIEAGEEVPYQQSSENGGTAIVFKKAVLGLKVTPQVLPGNKVLLHLQINQDRPSNNFVLGMPTISTRQIITSILVKNGQTMVLGGIYETNLEAGEKRIPFIYQIPILGWLFKQQNIRRNKRELLIFVTPNIVT